MDGQTRLQINKTVTDPVLVVICMTTDTCASTHMQVRNRTVVVLIDVPAESNLPRRQHAQTLRASLQMQVRACVAVRACALETLGSTATQATMTDAVQYRLAHISMAESKIASIAHVEHQTALFYIQAHSVIVNKASVDHQSIPGKLA